MFDYIRVSCCVPDIAVADVAGNAVKIGNQMRKAAEQGTSIAVFPELCLTGYTCQDLFFQQTLLDDCGSAAQELAALSGELQITAVIGMPVSVNGQIYNCAVVLDRGTVAGIVPKHFLPNYGEYYEKRWFSSAEDLPEDRTLEVRLGDLRTAFGRNMLFRAADVTFGVELCEDLWTPLPPSTFLPSASSRCSASAEDRPGTSSSEILVHSSFLSSIPYISIFLSSSEHFCIFPPR